MVGWKYAPFHLFELYPESEGKLRRIKGHKRDKLGKACMNVHACENIEFACDDNN